MKDTVWIGLPLVFLMIADYLQVKLGNDSTGSLMGALIVIGIGCGVFGCIRFAYNLAKKLSPILPPAGVISGAILLGLVFAGTWALAVLILLVNVHLLAGGRP